MHVTQHIGKYLPGALVYTILDYAPHPTAIAMRHFLDAYRLRKDENIEWVVTLARNDGWMDAYCVKMAPDGGRMWKMGVNWGYWQREEDGKTYEVHKTWGRELGHVWMPYKCCDVQTRDCYDFSVRVLASERYLQGGIEEMQKWTDNLGYFNDFKQCPSRFFSES